MTVVFAAGPVGAVNGHVETARVEMSNNRPAKILVLDEMFTIRLLDSCGKRMAARCLKLSDFPTQIVKNSDANCWESIVFLSWQLLVPLRID